MTYTPPKYPAEIPTGEDLPDRTDEIDWIYAARYNELKKEMIAIMTELGVLPKGSYDTVKARLDALNVYGTFTPAIVAVSGSITAGVAKGWYVKIGKLVKITINILVSSVSSPSGACTITGLPFTSLNLEDYKSACSIQPYDMNATAATMMTGDVENNTTVLRLFHFAAGVRGDCAADFKAGTRIIVSATYIAE